MDFEDKFIAFIDILGFKNMVEAAESGSGLKLDQILKNLEKLGTPQDEIHIRKHGGSMCPASQYVKADLDFKLTQISDCAIVTTEISPKGLINLVSHCWNAVIELLIEGVLCRGYITRESIFHQDNQVIGSGYQNAFLREHHVSAFKIEPDERGTPFVEIDPAVCTYIEESGDECVKKMFSRLTKTESGTTALFPFRQLSHPLSLDPAREFDPEKEKRANDVLRSELVILKERIWRFVDETDSNAERKTRHYIMALDEQISACDKTDEMIERLCGGFLPRP